VNIHASAISQEPFANTSTGSARCRAAPGSLCIQATWPATSPRVIRPIPWAASCSAGAGKPYTKVDVGYVAERTISSYNAGDTFYVTATNYDAEGNESVMGEVLEMAVLQ